MVQRPRPGSRRGTRWIAAACALTAAMAFGRVRADDKKTAPVPAVAPPLEALMAADASLVRIQTSSTRVRHMLDLARREKDVVKAVCLNDKLLQLENTLKTARERSQALRAAIGRGDIDVRNHELAVIGNVRGRAERLESEANQCLGEPPPIEPGKTKVVVTIDPNIAPVDPSIGPTPPTLIVPPAPASGYK